jgi:hypothetical protein
VKAATVIGAALGVAVGCLLGMSPLLFMEPGAPPAAGAACSCCMGSHRQRPSLFVLKPRCSHPACLAACEQRLRPGWLSPLQASL